MAAGDQADAPEWRHTCSSVGTGSPSCNPDHPGTGDFSCSPDTIIGTGVYSCSPLIYNTGTGARADAHQRGHTCNPNTNTHVTGTSDYTCSPSYVILNRTCGTEQNETELASLGQTQWKDPELALWFSYLEEELPQDEKWARKNIRCVQSCQKAHYDCRATQPNYQVGDCVIVHMPARRQGELRKLALPFEGPYKIVRISSTGVEVQALGCP